jgi:hypothetical protein
LSAAVLPYDSCHRGNVLRREAINSDARPW